MRGLLFVFLTAGLLAQTAPKAAAPAAKAGTARAKTARAATAKSPAAKAKSAAPALATDDEKTIYALGASVYRSLAAYYLTPAELEILKRAITDAAAGKPAIDVAPWEPKAQPLADERGRAASKQYLVKAAAEKGAIKTESGLIYREVTPGTGESPQATDTVKVNYRGTFVNGNEFDSSYKRNQPAIFPLNRVIKCWTEGVQRMKVGGKSILVCPSDLAYGEQGSSPIPGGATLIFEVELLGIGGN
jgi:FKBP-type peptidyl-prolyl cis-trans isomerase FkpA